MIQKPAAPLFRKAGGNADVPADDMRDRGLGSQGFLKAYDHESFENPGADGLHPFRRGAKRTEYWRNP